MADIFSYKLKSFDDFRPFIELFRTYCDKYRMDDTKFFELEVSLEELIINTFSHGFVKSKDIEPQINVSACMKEGDIKITIEDLAPAFNLLREAPEPDISPEIEKRNSNGGLGIHLVKNLTDHVEYLRSQGKNRITLFKSIKED